jgi:uncharacterized membrane protein
MKLNILFGILIFLVIANIAAVDTYLYLHLSDRSPASDTSPGTPPTGQGTDPLAQLNEGQREKLHEMMETFKRSTGELNGRIRVLDDEILKLVQEDTIQKSLIERDLNEISTLRLEISKKALDEIIGAKAFLSKDQQERLFSGIFRTKAAPTPARSESANSAIRPDQRRQDAGSGRPPIPPPQQNRLKKYTEVLNLTSSQAAQVKDILESSWKKYSALGAGSAANDASSRDSLKKIMDDEDSRIEKILNPAQMEKFKEMKKKHDRNNPPGERDEQAP